MNRDLGLVGGDVPEVLRQLVFGRQLPLHLQLHDRGRGKLLGDRADVEDRSRGVLLLVLDVAVPVPLGDDNLPPEFDENRPREALPFKRVKVCTHGSDGFALLHPGDRLGTGSCSIE